MKVYGIKNCSTVKKACVWLESKGVEFEFVDFKKTPPDEALLSAWVDKAGIETVVNKRGTTWRKLTDEEKTSVLENGNLAIISENPSTIKRPVLETDQALKFGFDEEAYQTLIS